jgi:hypothetical protein
MPTPLTREQAAEKWSLVVQALLAIRRSPVRPLVVTGAGEATLNAVKTYAEGAADRISHASWLSWPVTVCAKIAGVLHALNGDAVEDPVADTWADAQRFTEWLIDAHVRSVGGFRPKSWGLKRRFHPPRPDDLQRMRLLIRTRRTGDFRELVRYLPKRPPGYWRIHFTEITGAPPGPSPADKLAFAASLGGDDPSPTRSTYPTRPTSDARIRSDSVNVAHGSRRPPGPAAPDELTWPAGLSIEALDQKICDHHMQ